MRRLSPERVKVLRARLSQDLPSVDANEESNRPESWRSRANCAEDNVNPELFYIGLDDEVRQAKRICLGCVVVDECLKYALSRGEEYGIWGGMTVDDRKKLLRRRRREALQRGVRR